MNLHSMERRLFYPIVLNGMIAVLLLGFVFAAGFRDSSQAVLTLAFLAFGFVSTARTLLKKQIHELYSDNWLLHFQMQPLSLLASVIVLVMIARFGSEAGWALGAASFLGGARMAFVYDGIRRSEE